MRLRNNSNHNNLLLILFIITFCLQISDAPSQSSLSVSTASTSKPIRFANNAFQLVTPALIICTVPISNIVLVSIENTVQIQ